ncbi:hypothetical protein [Microlunatus parietis]|uniref:Transcriptional regulator n=2 Tax=Microlunatus parietis TaxID=682979 RepID=A0A7Y9I3S7_9ACTN|nr:hypothetical protein [Microlunatus parietis]
MSEEPKRPQNGPDVTVGLVGQRRLLREMQSCAQQVIERYAPQRLKFVTAPTDDGDEEAAIERIADRIDAAVFPGPWLYDRIRRTGWLTVPATHVALSGSALYSALLRARLADPAIDLTRLSIDSLRRSDVVEAYEELGLSADRVRCLAYTGPESVGEFAGFHAEGLASGEASLALTTILSVERELRAAGHPVLRLSPTRATVRDAIETAVLLGQGTRLGANRIAMIAVRLITAPRSAAQDTDYWQQELALAAQQRLLTHGRRAGATVTRRSDTLFLVTTTHEGLDLLTERLQLAPFMSMITASLGVPVAVGVGVGPTARSAEANALGAVEESLAGKGTYAVYRDSGGDRIDLPPGSSDTARVESVPDNGSSQDDRLRAIMDRLVERADEDQPVIADVETVAAAMAVTPRTGRRMLKDLVAAGLAWPLPSAPSAGGGRPRQLFRLLTEKLE